MQKRTPLIIAIVLLLLPVLYVGTYLVLVTPDGSGGNDNIRGVWYYRYNTRSWAGTVFWPLEQFDRKVRPRAWIADPFG